MDELPRILNELEVYENSGRQAYLGMNEMIKPGCDLVVDGMKKPDEIAKDIVEELNLKN